MHIKKCKNIWHNINQNTISSTIIKVSIKFINNIINPSIIGCETVLQKSVVCGLPTTKRLAFSEGRQDCLNIKLTIQTAYLPKFTVGNCKYSDAG